MIAWLTQKAAAKMRREADAIDRENPGPYYPGTLGAEWHRFANNLRALAEQLDDGNGPLHVDAPVGAMVDERPWEHEGTPAIGCPDLVPSRPWPFVILHKRCAGMSGGAE